jgi:hypothetical protein
MDDIAHKIKEDELLQHQAVTVSCIVLCSSINSLPPVESLHTIIQLEDFGFKKYKTHQPAPALSAQY